ncbi:hypothetical protein, partial [Janthinobacterium sp.]|uniref:hypothetical protein n=1 Tax=Janthinobacterium sp. TaxID=1871054 RepID=UPI00293D91BF
MPDPPQRAVSGQSGLDGRSAGLRRAAFRWRGGGAQGNPPKLRKLCAIKSFIINIIKYILDIVLKARPSVWIFTPAACHVRSD